MADADFSTAINLLRANGTIDRMLPTNDLKTRNERLLKFGLIGATILGSAAQVSGLSSSNARSIHFSGTAPSCELIINPKTGTMEVLGYSSNNAAQKKAFCDAVIRFNYIKDGQVTPMNGAALNLVQKAMGFYVSQINSDDVYRAAADFSVGCSDTDDKAYKLGTVPSKGIVLYSEVITGPNDQEYDDKVYRKIERLKSDAKTVNVGPQQSGPRQRYRPRRHSP